MNPNRFAAATTAFGAAAVMMVMSAPAAAADVTGFNIDPGLSTGSANVYGLGCSYTISATVDRPELVYFGAGALATFGESYVSPVNGRAQTTWTPRATGTYYVSASTGEGAGLSVQSVKVTVGKGIPIGSGCLVLP